MNYVIYRGPLERARLAFIFESLEVHKNSTELIWIFPAGILPEEKKGFSFDFLNEFGFKKIHYLEHSLPQYLRTKKEISKITTGVNINMFSLIGFSALEFGYGIKANKKLWFVNGVPEENELSEQSIIKKKITGLVWASRRFFLKDVDLVVTVSNRMSHLIKAKSKVRKIFAAPTCVDTSLFVKDPGMKSQKIYCYLGSGAAWQAIDLLSKVWKELFSQDNTIKFRVISRDDRTHQLAEGIPQNQIEFFSTNDFEEVAKLVGECSVGFLLRKDNVVNRVSFPTKLAEYLASGCWVVSTNIDWDIRDYFQKFNIGPLVSPEEDPEKIAETILKFERNFDKKILEKNIQDCTTELDRETWKAHLMREIELLN